MEYLQLRHASPVDEGSCSSCRARTSSSSSSAPDSHLAAGADAPSRSGKAARPRPLPARGALGDAELEGIPAAFLRDSLLLLAPRLLAGADRVTPVVPPSSSAHASVNLLPPSLDCLLEPLQSDVPAGYALVPTHLLAVTVPSPACPGAVEHVLVPVHSLPWSLASPTLGAHLAACAAAQHLDDEGRVVEPAAPPTPPASPPSRSLTALPRLPSSTPPPPSPSHVSLPVLHLTLPSLAGLTALHAFVYTRALGPLPLDADALGGVGACARALGVEGEVGSELEEVLDEAWARLGWTVEASEGEADDEEWESEEGGDETKSGCGSGDESE
ncbi:hypothetical protein JCM8208_005523 [Rhodotorula glutinis]